VKSLVIRDLRLFDNFGSHVEHFLPPGENVVHFICQMSARLSFDVVFHTNVQLKWSGIQPDTSTFEHRRPLDLLHPKEADIKRSRLLQRAARDIHLSVIDTKNRHRKSSVASGRDARISPNPSEGSCARILNPSRRTESRACPCPMGPRRRYSMATCRTRCQASESLRKSHSVPSQSTF